jgi:hypothetical protein
VAVGPVQLFTKGWHVLVLFVMTALSWACGSDAICPSGTGGALCAPTDDLGAPPDVLEAARDRDNDDVLEASAPEVGADDAEGSTETETTTQFLREAPDALWPTSPRYRMCDGRLAVRFGHATDYERAAECAVQPGEHVDSRGAPPWRPSIHVEREHGPIGWLRAA